MAEYKLPNVFVGCPYSKGFNFSAFKAHSHSGGQSSDHSTDGGY